MIIRYSSKNDLSYKKELYRLHQHLRANCNRPRSKMKVLAKVDSHGQIIANKMGRGFCVNQENELASLLKSAQNRNKNLESFLYIVSHNLRTHTGNLQSMLGFYKEAKQYEEQAEILSFINSISTKLNATIGHLAEIVKIDRDAEDGMDSKKIPLRLETIFKDVLAALQCNIKSSNAFINHDFSKCQDVYYLPAYLESIFHNLLTNSIKYRDRNRQVIINCESKIEDGYSYITFEDNGLGMDLEKYGHKVFGLYETFHQNADSHGVGLYVTRVQIESLGGTISVQSTLSQGTKFTIKLSKI
jgi:signal transduction histidine kinase